MFRTLTGLSTAAIVLAASVGAHALTLTNRDASEYTVTVEDDEGETAVVVAPNGSAVAECPKGCVLVIGEEEPMEFEGTETVFIEGGKLKQ